MKYINLVILFLLFSLSSCSGLTKPEQIVNSIINNHSKIEKRDSGLTLIALGSSIPDNVHGFIVRYASNKVLTIPEARKLYIKSFEKLLKMINDNVDLRPFMHEYPFTGKNLNYMLAFYDKEGCYTEPPYVALVTLVNEKVHYGFHEKNKIGFIKEKEVSEPYAEAVRIVREEMKE